jgi:S-sulfo-L-cysteine synthase (3-phospho-L-serine-dependent)
MTTVAHTPLDLIGNTPAIRLEPPLAQGRGYWAKLEGFNPNGIKDRAALEIVRRARERGELRPGGTIVESSSGTFALGLALVGIGLGHPVITVVEPRLGAMMQHLLDAYGATIEMVADAGPHGSWVRARRERVRELVATLPGAWWPNQYDNPDNVAAYEGMAEELIDQFDRIDILVCSVGTGGHSAGLTRRLRQVWPAMKLIGVDAVGSMIFGQSVNRGVMTGLGNTGFYSQNVAYDLFDEVHWVNPAEAAYVCRELGETCYVTGGWSVGCVGLVAAWLARTHDPQARIVGVFCDGPERYWNTVFDDAYLREQELYGIVPADEPDEIAHPKALDVTRWTRCRMVVDPRTLALAPVGAAGR